MTRTSCQPAEILPERLRATLPHAAAEALESLCLAAAAEGLPLYLVGGLLRDHLLLDSEARRPPHTPDIDLAVDGDPTPLHGALSHVGLGQPVIHDRFGTASVQLTAESAARIDLARTRSERYSTPGALPEVEPAPILVDLERRDFTINAAALALTGANAGTLLDPHGAAADIHSRTIRTLHPRSFIDDPTRLIRAARYAARLGARLARQTAQEAKREGHHLTALTPGRFSDAWRLLLSEPDAAAALYWARRMRLPQARWADWAVAPRIGRIAQTPAQFWAGVGLTEPSRTVLNELPLRITLQRRELSALNDGARLRTLRRRIARRPRPAAVARMLEGINAAALTAAEGLWSGASAQALSEFSQRRPSVEPPIRGPRLIELGVPRGPAVGLWLQWLSDAVWDHALDPTDADTVARIEQRVASHPETPPRRPLRPATPAFEQS